jgi:CHAT domain-containing protein/tetratricopeptide (TPR) repeat protein
MQHRLLHATAFGVLLLAASVAASQTAAATRAFEGTLAFATVSGPDCSLVSGRALPATILLGEHWLIRLAEGGVHRLDAAADGPHRSWQLRTVVRPGAITEELKLDLAGTGAGCTIERAAFTGRRTAATPDADSWQRLLQASDLLDASRAAFTAMRWQEARRDAEAALLAIERELGPDHSESRIVRRHAAGVQAWQGELTAALDRMNAACLYGAGAAPDSGVKVQCATARAEMLALAGRLREAAEVAKDLETLPQEGELSRADRVLAQLTHADVLRRISRMADALALAESAAETADTTLPANHPARARALIVLATARTFAGAPGALETAERSLAAATEVFGPRHPRTGLAQMGLSTAYFYAGRFTESLRPAERAFEILADSLGEAHYQTLGIMLNLASIYLRFERHQEALDVYRRVEQGFRTAFGEAHPARLIALRNTAIALRRLDRTEEALATNLDLLAIARAAYGPRHDTALMAMRGLGSDYHRLGRYDEALEITRQAIALYAEVFGPRHPDTFEQRIHGARVLRDMKRYEESIAEGEAVLAELQETFGRAHDDVLSAMGMLADTYEFSGRIADARALVEELVSRYESQRGIGNYALEWRQAQFARVVNVYRNLTKYYVHEGRTDDAFRVAELMKARTLLEALSLRRAEDTGVLPAAEVQALGDLEKAVADLDQRVTAARVEDRLRTESERNAAAERLAERRAQLRERFPRYAQMTEVRIATAAEARRLVDPHTALISYALTDRRLAVFVVTHAGVVALDVGDMETLASNIESYRRLLEPGGRVRIWRVGDGYVASVARPAGADTRAVGIDEVAQRLSQQLLEPIAALLRGRSKWIVSPDGELAVLPFEALPFDGRPVIAGRSVSYVQSASVLALMKQRPARAATGNDRALFAMGAPYYPKNETAAPARARGGSGAMIASVLRSGDAQRVQQAYELMGQHWEPLPGAEAEVKAIHALFPGGGSHLALGTDASEASLLAHNTNGDLARYRYLHFAVHGHLSTDAPLLSALVLAQGGNPPGIDGYVTAAEWLLYRLNSDLIVLSACQSGLGTRIQGEGVMGIPYALFVAGNRRTLLSLWPVSDASTARFMTRFYSKLQAGVPIAEALAAVKREFMRGGRDANPMHWAGFVLYGD